MKTTIKSKIMKGLLVILLILLIAYSFQAKAQSRGRRYYRSTYGYSKDFGVELAMAAPHFTLQSNIGALNGLRTSYLGFNAGGVVVNTYSKVKVTFGMYSSDDSTPYTIDLMQGSVTWNLYILRMEQPESHIFEPYFLLGANVMHSKYYGNYLLNDPNANYSVSDPTYLGHAGWAYATVGLGVEYHLENEALKFIHFFAQAAYGVPAITIYADKAFSQTVAMGSGSYTFGINFAVTK